MEPIMKEYCELVGFLGKVLGQDYEIILHDLSNMDHSVIAVANGHVSGRRIGSPMNENGLRLIRSGAWKDNPEMIRYRGYSKKSNQLLCFARFIKNQEGEPIGMLCINYDYTNSQKLVDSLTEQLGIASLPDQAESEKYFKSDTEKFPDNMEEVVYGICNQVLSEATVPVDRPFPGREDRHCGKAGRQGSFSVQRRGSIGSRTAPDLRGDHLPVSLQNQPGRRENGLQ